MKWYALFVKTGDEENVRVYIKSIYPIEKYVYLYLNVNFRKGGRVRYMRG